MPANVSARSVPGRFADMLIAVTQHPAMLIYLDNTASIGPNSRTGQRRGRGLNENLAREILELHTLSVNSGYSQADVISLAEILTGWSFGNMRRGNPGEFGFFNSRHEPDSKLLLGRMYEEDGVNEGKAALRALAARPSTAHFIASKLARHFIADAPPKEAVDQLSLTFLHFGGDLGAVSRQLVSLSECWKAPLAKVKTPSNLVVSAFHLFGPPSDEKLVLAPLRLLG